MQGQTTPALRVKVNLEIEDDQAPAQDNPNSPLYAGDRVSDCQRKHGMALHFQVTGEWMSWCQRPDSDNEIWPPGPFFSLTAFISWGGSGEGRHEWDTLLNSWHRPVMDAKSTSLLLEGTDAVMAWRCRRLGAHFKPCQLPRLKCSNLSGRQV